MAGPALLAADPREQELLALYDRAERFIARQINAAIARGAKGTAVYYENQTRAVERELERLRSQAAPLERALSASAYSVGVAAVETTVDRAAAFTDVHGAAVDVVVGNLVGRLRHAEEFIGRMANDTFRRIGLEQTGLAMASGFDARTQRVNIERELRRNGITAFVDRRGRRWTLSSYARMVTRTTTREAATAGTTNRMREVGLDLVTISQHPGSCPICRPLQGRTFSVSGYSRNYPKAEVLPPIHPNCRHVVYPAHASFEEFEAALGLAPDPGLVGQLGLLDEPRPPEVPAQPEPIVPEVAPDVAGKDVSSLVDVSSRAKAAKPMNAALREIDKVHGVGDHVSNRIKVETNSRMRSYGRFRGFDLRPSAKDSGRSLIEINTAKQDLAGQALSAIHETGHYLDQWALPGGGLTKGSRRWDRGEPAAVGGVMEAIAQSPPILALDRALGLKGAERLVETGVPGMAKLSHLRYLLKPEEQFARAYAQYIATKSGWTALKTAVDDDRGFIPQRQWTEEEFAPIFAAFEKLFRDLDLLRT